MNLADLREEYSRAGLTAADVAADPLEQFKRWLAEALEASVPEPTAMTLATASSAGRPSARVVLLKGVDADGFAFFTNYESRKGQELAANPWAALVLWWPPLQRQVRIEGRVERLAPADSDAYYDTRPRGSRLGAWASPQSQVIADRDVLERRLAKVEAEFAADAPERPPFWGGYRLVPVAVEFWQGRPSRLHDRLRYGRDDDGTWHLERLAP